MLSAVAICLTTFIVSYSLGDFMSNFDMQHSTTFVLLLYLEQTRDLNVIWIPLEEK